MADIVNGRCHDQKAPEQSPPLIQHGKLVLQAHHIGWLVSGLFALMATVISVWLMNKHLQWYTNKGEQRYIIRILLMVPIYAIVSFASYLFWNDSTPLLLLRDCYESTVLTSFFYLLLVYLSPDVEEQKEIFRKNGLSRFNDRLRLANGEQPRKWMLPLRSLKWKPEDGLHFFQLMKWGVLQYCVIRPTTTLAAIILNYAGLYCEGSWSPGWGYLYITTIVSISVSISMYCLIQLYMPISTYLAPHKPLLKLFAVKAVVFLTFWQASFLSLLATFGLVKNTEYMTADNINIGIGAIIETVEMTLFAILHLRAFNYKPYVIPPLKTNRWRALLHAYNFMETLRELWAGTVYMWHRMRGRETDVLARRQGVLEGVFGKSRIEIQGGSRIASSSDKKRQQFASEKDSLAVRVAVEETVHVGEERQWLGVGDDYAYGLGYHSRKIREKSDGLEEQIERELAVRGFPRRQSSSHRQHASGYGLIDEDEAQPGSSGKGRRERSSWWRGVYNRLSGSEPPPVPEIPPESTFRVERRSQRRQSKRKSGQRLSSIDLAAQTYEDPPPPSTIRRYREHKKCSLQGDANKPLLHKDLPKPPIASTSLEPSQPGPSTEVEVRRPPLATVYEARASPVHSATSIPSSSGRPDSFFGRAFAAQSDVSYSTDTLTAGATSNQSHQSQVRLTVGPEPIVSNKRKPVTRKPVRYSAPVVPPTVFMDAQIEQPLMPAPPAQHNTEFPRIAKSSAPPHRRSTWDDQLKDGPANQVPTAPSRRSYVPRRDQIVFPAPLTPSSAGPSTPPPDVPNYANDAASITAPLPTAILDASRAAVPSPANSYPSPPRSPHIEQTRGSSTLRRSQHTNMRRYSHTFVQQPPLSASDSRPSGRRGDRRHSTPLRGTSPPDSVARTDADLIRRP